MTITKSFYKRSDGILLVYDISSAKSFQRLDKWMENIEVDASARIPKYLIGNKVDLEENREVGRDEGEQFAAQHKMQFFETSAKTNVNVTESFEELIKEAFRSKNERIVNPSIFLNTSEKKQEKKQCC
eukprot:TRINITY_DN3063_c0_g9_i1.p1 TRINITY_DN3063_c0_g9~~TRINITY_DN3063_c0_g9_i1.p1  ORF type:complete len:128 (+),score=47.50 TRINITY_DN3063_c0_g9_i1:3-386(+)